MSDKELDFLTQPASESMNNDENSDNVDDQKQSNVLSRKGSENVECHRGSSDDKMKELEEKTEEEGLKMSGNYYFVPGFTTPESLNSPGNETKGINATNWKKNKNMEWKLLVVHLRTPLVKHIFTIE